MSVAGAVSASVTYDLFIAGEAEILRHTLRTRFFFPSASRP